MLHIKFSNRLELLLGALLDEMAEPPKSPFASQQIIVPSTAMQRKLELSLADRFGICSNVRFSFLAQWLWHQIGQVVPVQEVSPFTPPVLAWRVFQILDDAAFVRNHPRLAGYLQKADPVMRYDLATKTASLLEQYITYRPDWLAAWSDGKTVPLPDADPVRQEDQRWQSALWRRIIQDLGTSRQHPAAAFFQAVESLGPKARAVLPETAHVFCLPAMPPLYLDILRQLGRWIDLHLYVLNPCREYWFEIVDRRRLSYLAAQGDAACHEVGNRLLAAWGKQSQAHIDLLLDDADQTSVDDGRFMPHGGGTLLAHVQNAILDLVELAPGSIGIAQDDRSVEVHVCHSLTRELEVLQDQLLALFAGPNPPQPSDVLVVTPDLEEASPLIDAVFGNAPSGRRIPYAITGRPRSTLNPAARALLDLLSLATSRFQASAVFDLLQQPVVNRRFGIAGTELESIHAWIRDSGIRWGIDAADREQLDLPDFERYSFSDGLHRLFLGYALPADVAFPFSNRLPAGNPEGSEAAALGCFWNFIRQLEALRQNLAAPKAPEEWMNALFDMLGAFLIPANEQIEDFREVRDAIRELQGNMSRGGIANPIPLEMVRASLAALLDEPARGGIPTGSVTFSSMTSLRNLPYRVICAIGLNDGAFPTAARPAEFDLMALSPRRGDRQRRSDERNLFLDLVLAARDRLYLSYTGRSVRDNSALPPSVLISDLVDTLAPAIAMTDARKRLLIEHPLQPFSPAYFSQDGDARIASFNDEYCDALRRGLAAPAAIAAPMVEAAGEDDEEATESVQAFFRLPLAEPEDEWREVTLEQLIQFFRNPCRYLLRQRLGIELAEGEEELLDDEPFLPDWPGRSALAERLLPLYLGGLDLAEIRAAALAGTEYPPGRMGECLLDRELQLLGQFAQGLAQEAQPACLPPHHGSLEFVLNGKFWRLTGGFSDLRPCGLIRHSYDDVRAADYLAGWLSHLFVNATLPAGVAPQTAWHSRDGRYVIQPCDRAQDHLRELLTLYRQGLCKPLHFFPKSAWNYVASGGNISKARGTWHSTRQHPFGEDRNAAYRLALRGVADPLDLEFEACARTVFEPLLQYLEDPRLA